MKHRHNDYSCYIYIVNKSESPLQLVDAKPIFGKWAHGSPPTEIQPNTDALIELTDPRGPHGSEGRCTYRLHHPQRSSAITFKLRFGDPYWAKDDNYLRAYTQYPQWISLKVPKYQSKGHPFIAHVEVSTLEVSESDRRRLRRGFSESSVMSFRSDGDTESIAETLSESLPDYELRSPITPNFGKQPIHIIETVDEDDDDGDRDYFSQDKKHDHSIDDDPDRSEPNDSMIDHVETPEVKLEDKVEPETTPEVDGKKVVEPPAVEKQVRFEAEDITTTSVEPIEVPEVVSAPTPTPSSEQSRSAIEVPPTEEKVSQPLAKVEPEHDHAEKEDDNDEDFEDDYLRATEGNNELTPQTNSQSQSHSHPEPQPHPQSHPEPQPHSQPEPRSESQSSSSRSIPPPSNSDSDSNSKPMTIQPSKALAWLTTYFNLNIFRGWSETGKIGIIATVFLATYGFTLSRISGGLLHGRRRW